MVFYFYNKHECRGIVTINPRTLLLDALEAAFYRA